MPLVETEKGSQWDRSSQRVEDDTGGAVLGDKKILGVTEDVDKWCRCRKRLW